LLVQAQAVVEAVLVGQVLVHQLLEQEELVDFLAILQLVGLVVHLLLEPQREELMEEQEIMGQVLEQEAVVRQARFV
jgi:hypothetical protein